MLTEGAVGRLVQTSTYADIDRVGPWDVDPR